MKTVKGIVLCANTNRPLFHPAIFWMDKDGNMHEHAFGSESEGFYEIEVPEYVNEIYIRNREYDSVVVQIKNINNHIITKLKKNRRNI